MTSSTHHEGNEPMSDERHDDGWLHPVNTGHLVMGIAFAGILAVWALFITDQVTTDDLRWLIPLPWVLAGAVGLVVATRANLRSRRHREGGA